MSIEQNKAVVLRHLTSMADGGDPDLVAEDMRYWMPGVGSISRAEFAEVVKRLGPVLRTPVHLTVDHVTAEGDRVAVEARGHAETADGRSYDNIYHFLFFLRDGRIVEQREHNDTAYAYSVLGTGLTEGMGD